MAAFDAVDDAHYDRAEIGKKMRAESAKRKEARKTYQKEEQEAQKVLREQIHGKRERSVFRAAAESVLQKHKTNVQA